MQLFQVSILLLVASTSFGWTPIVGINRGFPVIEATTNFRELKSDTNCWAWLLFFSTIGANCWVWSRETVALSRRPPLGLEKWMQIVDVNCCTGLISEVLAYLCKRMRRIEDRTSQYNECCADVSLPGIVDPTVCNSLDATTPYNTQISLRLGDFYAETRRSVHGIKKLPIGILFKNRPRLLHWNPVTEPLRYLGISEIGSIVGREVAYGTKIPRVRRILGENSK